MKGLSDFSFPLLTRNPQSSHEQMSDFTALMSQGLTRSGWVVNICWGWRFMSAPTCSQGLWIGTTWPCYQAFEVYVCPKYITFPDVFSQMWPLGSSFFQTADHHMQKAHIGPMNPRLMGCTYATFLEPFLLCERARTHFSSTQFSQYVSPLSGNNERF